MSTHMPSFDDCWFLIGATASGKTDVGIELARTLGAEIVSLDSMALYRGMDIGTAKPSAEERARVPHHLLDLLEPHEEFSVAQYVTAANQVCQEIRSRGRVPLFVGGTPLYLKALLRGLFVGPPADWEFRGALQERAATEGSAILHAELEKIDPLTAQRLHSQDTRRVIRALEVFAKTGQSITLLQKQFDRARLAEECRVFCLAWPRELIGERIDRRVDAMLAAGWVEEVKRLSLAPKLPGRTALQAVGYRELLDHLYGKHTLDEVSQLIKIRTRQFAKRQRTWFRSFSECRSVPVQEPFEPVAVAAQIYRQGSNG